MSSIKYPEMRSELVYTLQDLSDRKLQEKEWISTKVNFTFWSNFILAYNFLFYDLSFENREPDEQIGYSLKNKQEAEILKPLVNSIVSVLNEIGKFQPDETYYTSPLWDELVEASRKAYELLSKNDAEVELNKS